MGLYEISIAFKDKSNWVKWKKENIDNYKKGYTEYSYYIFGIRMQSAMKISTNY